MSSKYDVIDLLKGYDLKTRWLKSPKLPIVIDLLSMSNLFLQTIEYVQAFPSILKIGFVIHT